MISRIRLEAYGRSATEVEHVLVTAADLLEKHLRLQASLGEQVIEKNMGEPQDGHTAFFGRLVIHPNVASDSAQGSLYGTNYEFTDL